MAVCFAVMADAQVALTRPAAKTNRLESFVNSLQSQKVLTVMENTRTHKGNAVSNRMRLTDEDLVSSPVTPPEDLETENYVLQGTFRDNSGVQTLNNAVLVGFDGKDVYISGLSYYMGNDGWVKGTLSEDGKSVSFQSPQYYGQAYDVDLYFIVNYYIDDDNDTYPTVVTLEYDAEKGEFIFPEYFYLLEGSEPVNSWACYGYSYDLTLTKGEVVEPELVEVPEGVDHVEGLMKATIEDEDGDYDISVPVFVAVDGSDVYLKGLSDNFPDSWVKGTLSGTTVTFEPNQYVGSYFGYAFYFGNTEPVVFEYDSNNASFTCDGYEIYYSGEAYEVYKDVTIVKIAEVACVPADPEFYEVSLDGEYPYISYYAPIVGTKGENMTTGKLYVRFFYEVDGTVSQIVFTPELYEYLDESMTEVLYGFTDDYDFYTGTVYLNMDLSDWTRIGIQTVYYGGGETNVSNVVWYTIPETTEGISDVLTNGKNSVTYDLLGRVADKNAKGLLIKTTRQSDGTLKTEKVLNK